jgi:hypothetical protein
VLTFAQHWLQQGLSALAQQDNARACDFLQKSFFERRGKPWNLCNETEQAVFFDFSGPPIPPEVPLHKLLHDFEQLNYLIQIGKLPASVFAALLAQLSTAIQSLSQRFPEAPTTALLALNSHEQQLLRPIWGRLLYLENLAEIATPLISPLLDKEKVAWSYHQNQPGFSFVDQILSEPVLNLIRAFMLNSTIWHDYLRGGYVGSYLPDCFCSPLLLQLADELKIAFPQILSSHPLSLMWGYKYDSHHPGVGIHADSDGRVNFNLWLTPDEANLEPERGGLIVYDVMAPEDWSPSKYKIEDLIKDKPCKAYKLSYRCNRGLFFNSGLFHASDQFSFKSGYLNRRLNLTLLFGVRGQ